MSKKIQNTGYDAETKTRRQKRYNFLKGIIVCLMIPLLVALMLGLCLGRKIVGISFLIGGLHTVTLFCFLQSDRGKTLIESGETGAEKLLKNSNEHAKQCYFEVKMIYTCRYYAAIRLIRDESKIQIISIIYSVFTALLALLSLRGDDASFLALPSVMFTVAVAILVTFANAQKCGARANDLFTNCRDLRMRLDEVTKIVDEWKDSISSTEKKTKEDELMACMKAFSDNLGDSEEHTIVDEWKYCGSWLFNIYLMMKILFCYSLILIPVLFLLCNLDNILKLF